MNVYCVLSGWESVQVTGPDAKDYFQRITTADFRPLAPGRFTTAALLAPTGKIQLYFKALCRGSGDYFLMVPGSAQEAFEILERMHFRENFTIKPQASKMAYLRVLLSGAEPLSSLSGATSALREVAAAAVGSMREDGGILALNEGRWARAPFALDLGLLIEESRLAEVSTALEAVGITRAPSCEPYRLRAADPGVPTELNATVIPLEARLDDAVHENKGCYPGQEVVERIRSMGQVPRMLVQIRGQGATVPAPQSPILLQEGGETNAGVVTSAAPDPIDGGWVGLAYLRRTLAKPDATYMTGGQGVQVLFP